MFDISWSDPQRETVAHRRNRKKQNQVRGPPQESSSRAAEIRYRPGMLDLFDGNTKNIGTGQESLRSESISSSQSNYSRTLTTSALSNFPLKQVDTEALKSPLKSSKFSDFSRPTSVELELSAWTGSSTPTESTASFTDESTSKWFLIQPLSPRSYVSQITEITSSTQASVAEAEIISAVSVRIFADACGDIEEEAPKRRPSFFDIPLLDHDELHDRSEDKADDIPPKSPSTYPWTPPVAWNQVGP